MTCKHDRNVITRLAAKEKRRELPLSLDDGFELPHKSRSRTMKENQCHVVWFNTNRESCIESGRLCNVQNDPFCSILNNI